MKRRDCKFKSWGKHFEFARHLYKDSCDDNYNYCLRCGNMKKVIDRGYNWGRVEEVR